VNNPLLLVIYAAAIFSVVTLGGLAALRGLKNAALRAVLFVALCYVLFKGTFWLSRQWSLDPVELGYAWALALLVLVIVGATITVRRRKQVTNTQ
jgi:hypothetical protein